MDCKKEMDKLECTCSSVSCTRRGVCCECLAYHRSNGEIPSCFFSVDANKTLEKNIESLMKNNNAK